MIYRYAAPYQQALHSGGADGWTQNLAVVPEAGLPSIKGGHGLGFDEAEIVNSINKKEVSMI